MGVKKNMAIRQKKGYIVKEITEAEMIAKLRDIMPAFSEKEQKKLKSIQKSKFTQSYRRKCKSLDGSIEAFSIIPKCGPYDMLADLIMGNKGSKAVVAVYDNTNQITYLCTANKLKNISKTLMEE